jgi:co-chaperonin GroES (HSP10)
MSGGDWTSGYSGEAGIDVSAIRQVGPGRILVEQNVEEVRTYRGLYIPENTSMAKKVDTYGRVLQLRWEDYMGDPWIQEGDWVLFGKYNGVEFSFGRDAKKLYRFLKPEDIFAVVSEEMARGTSPSEAGAVGSPAA